MGTLAVRLIVPLVGPVADFHRQVIQATTTATGTAPVKALRAMPGAQRKSPALRRALVNELEVCRAIRT